MIVRNKAYIAGVDNSAGVTTGADQPSILPEGKTPAPLTNCLTDKRQMAAILQFSVRHVDNLIAQGMPHLKFGARRVRFNPTEVLTWCNEQYHTRRIGRLKADRKEVSS